VATEFKRVPAIDKCFDILQLLAKTREPMGITDIANALHYNKSTVFNLLHTLTDRGILESGPDNKFRFGATLYLLGQVAGKRSELLQIVHPYLEEIKEKTGLSAFLGIRSGMRAVILDKVDSSLDIKVSSDVGMRLPLLAGAHGKALLCQLLDVEVEKILSTGELQRFTPYSCVDRDQYRDMVNETREAGIAFSREDYIEGIHALAVPIRTGQHDLQAAVWAVGLKKQVPDEALSEFSALLKGIATNIEARFHAR
jgi:IclR family KDG regulon transcriptional repressor